MKCDCKQALEAKLLEKLKQETPDGANHSAHLSGYGMVIVGNKFTYRPCMEVIQSVDLPRKAGGWKNTKPKLNMFFSYCPFCGKSVNAEKPSDVEGGAAFLDFMPEWAVKRATGFLEVGVQLATKDGRRIGNAYVSALESIPGKGFLVTIVTDIGNSAQLNEQELKELFFDPVWVMDVRERQGRSNQPVECGAACADKSTSSEMLAALIVARETICFDRNAYAEANTPKGGRRIDLYDRDVLADYDAALLQINAAIVKGGAA